MSEIKPTVKVVMLKGERGEKGDTGAKGAKGDKGDTGATGASGAIELEKYKRAKYNGEGAQIDDIPTMIKQIRSGDICTTQNIGDTFTLPITPSPVETYSIREITADTVTFALAGFNTFMHVGVEKPHAVIVPVTPIIPCSTHMGDDGRPVKTPYDLTWLGYAKIGDIPTHNTSSPYTEGALHQFEESFLTMLPQEIQNAVIPREVLLENCYMDGIGWSQNGSSSSTRNPYQLKVWSPSDSEVFGWSHQEVQTNVQGTPQIEYFSRGRYYGGYGFYTRTLVNLRTYMIAVDKNGYYVSSLRLNENGENNLLPRPMFLLG